MFYISRRKTKMETPRFSGNEFRRDFSERYLISKNDAKYLWLDIVTCGYTYEYERKK